MIMKTTWWGKEVKIILCTFRKVVSFGIAFDWFFYLMKVEVDFICWRLEISISK